MTASEIKSRTNERRAQALQMRAAGKSYVEIGTALNIAKQYAWLLVNPVDRNRAPGPNARPPRTPAKPKTPAEKLLDIHDANPRCQKWAKFLKEKQRSSELTGRELAQLAAINESYLTLMKRDGYVPKRHIAARIGLAFGCPDEVLIACGYLPPSLKPEEIAGFLRGKPPARMPEDVAPMVRALCEAPHFLRQQVVAVAKTLLETQKRQEHKSQ